MKTFDGNILFLDRSDINTDEIIPAKYLTEITKEALKPFLLEDLVLDNFSPGRDIPGKSVLISRRNFGCGSSREHAPWALEMNGIHLVIAESFARIFRQNMYNCGMLAIELPEKEIEHIFDTFSAGPASLSLDLSGSRFTITGPKGPETIAFNISDFDRILVNAGGWVNYADSNY